MRRSLLILLLSTACLFARAQDTLDFTRFTWGTPLSAMQEQFGLKLLKEEGETLHLSQFRLKPERDSKSFLKS